MLPNHAPLVIAEQFGTLEALYPGRIDLGLGRAPGTDQPTMRALRRDLTSADTFPSDVQELQALLGDPTPGQHIQAVPGAGLARPAVDPRLEPVRRAARGRARAAVRVRVALRARRAGARDRGLPADVPAVRAARAAARDARRQRDRRRRRRRRRASCSPPRSARSSTASSGASAACCRRRSTRSRTTGSRTSAQQLESMLSCSFIGSPDTVRSGLDAFVREHQPDELIVTTSAFDQGARLHSLELLAALDVGAAVHECRRTASSRAAEHAELRAALYELVGRFLADYERSANAHGLTLTQARVLGFAACEPLSQRAARGALRVRPVEHQRARRPARRARAGRAPAGPARRAREARRRHRVRARARRSAAAATASGSARRSTASRPLSARRCARRWRLLVDA